MIIFDYNIDFCSADLYAFFSARELFKQIDTCDKLSECWKYIKEFTMFTGIKRTFLMNILKFQICYFIQMQNCY